MRPSRAARAAALLFGTMAFAVLAHLGIREKSPTFDEVAHLPAGYTHLTRLDFRLVPEQPPLVKMLAALPLLAMDVRVPEEDAAWARRRHYEFGRRFLFEWNDGQRLASVARHAMLTCAALLLALVAACGYWRWGAAVGGVSLYLGALHPDLLAHGPLVTSDVPVALLMFATVLAFERVLARPSAIGVAACGVLLGVAFAVKFSALILVPLLAGLALARGRRRERLGLLAALLVVTPLVIWAAYAFRAHVTPDPAVNESFTLDHERPSNPLVWHGALLAQRLRLLPDAYLYGLLRFARHSESRRAFLLGEHSDEGWWYYFPVTLALKTPLPLLLLTGAASVLALSDWRRHAHETWLWLPPLAYLSLSMSRSLNIGHRHLLPLLPFVLLGAARAFVALWRRGGSGGRAGLLLLLVWYGASVLRVHPHYLAYFNELVRPEQGHRFLVDSNLDWGQDLPGLKAYMRRNGIPRLKLSYFGTAEPRFYGIECDRLPGYPPPPDPITTVDPGDLVAVSATNLEAVYLSDDPDALRLMRRLKRQLPLASIGYSILIYRAEFSWRGR
jgi:4-amino-4-deoxy-L-arabinose transferase-like glycosyltransferase